MTDIIEQGFWYKVRYTPIRDALRGRMTARLDPRQQLDKAALPPQVKEALRRVVQATRLWRLERVEVLNELIAHFVDGMKSGISPDELLTRFGDEAQAARLIRRAKRRNRPMVWHALRVGAWSTVTLLIFYCGYAAYFFAGHPSPRINYLANINKSVESTPVEDRAWLSYRHALIGVASGDLQSISNLRLDVTCTSKDCRRLVDLIREHQSEVEWIRQGAAKPTFGWLLGANGSANDRELWPNHRPVETVSNMDDALVTAVLPPLSGLRDLAAMLRADAMLARETNDGKRLLQDIESTLNLSRQVAQNGPLLLKLMSLAISDTAMDQIEQTLRERPTLIATQDWIALANRLSTPKVAGDLMTYDVERMVLDDMLQRAYTDDGSGNGRITSEGLRFFGDATGSRNNWMKGAAEPAIGLFVASRQTLKSEYDRLFDVAEANLKVPLRNTDWRGTEEPRSRSYPLQVFLPTYTRTQGAAERSLGRRDGIVAAIALERYRQNHGNYPESLKTLVPTLLSEVPVDRITGEPVRYQLVAGQPLLYSVGANRKDDGGRYTFAPQDAARWDQKPEELADGDWVLYPTLK